jgi:hypothetical protein
VNCETLEVCSLSQGKQQSSRAAAPGMSAGVYRSVDKVLEDASVMEDNIQSLVHSDLVSDSV